MQAGLRQAASSDAAQLQQSDPEPVVESVPVTESLISALKNAIRALFAPALQAVR